MITGFLFNCMGLSFLENLLIGFCNIEGLSDVYRLPISFIPYCVVQHVAL